MIVALTAKLIAVPELAWPRLVAAVDTAERLPPPIGHAGALAAISVVATVIGAALAPGHTAAGVVTHGLFATAGYVGACATAIWVLPRLLRDSGQTPEALSRYGASAVLPLALSGVLNLIPLVGLGFIWTACGAALSARSAFLGASQFLALEGDRRRHAAALVAITGSVPVLISIGLRLLLIP